MTKEYFWKGSNDVVDIIANFHYVKALNRKYKITFSFGYKKISQSGQIQSPNATFIMICFHLPLACQDLYSIVCFVQIEWQTPKSKSNNIIAKNSGSACMYTSILEFCLFC